MEAYEITVFGDVQGVFYRHFAKEEAKKLNIIGWCQNEMNGTVRIFAQGEKDQINEFIEWTKIGSPMSKVSDLKIVKKEIDHKLKRFEIK